MCYLENLGAENSVQLPKCMYFMNHYILKPVTDRLFNIFETSINVTEDELLVNLQDKKDIFEIRNLIGLVKQLTIPLTIFYCLAFLGICCLIAVPYLLYSYLCSRRYDNRDENDVEDKYGYICKIVMAFFIIILLAFTTAGTLQMGVELDKSIRQYLFSTHSLIRNVQQNMERFSNEIEAFRAHTKNKTDYMSFFILDMPQKVSLKIVDLNTSNELNKINELLTNIPKQMDALKTAGLENNSTIFLIQEHLKYLKRNCSIVKNLTMQTDGYINDLLNKYNILTKDYKFPDIHKLFYFIDKGLETVPNILDEVISLNTIYAKLYTHTTEQLSNIARSIIILQQNFCSIFLRMFSSYKKFYGPQKEVFENFRLYLAKIYCKITSYHIYKDIYISTLIFMIPGLHSLIFVGLTMIAFVVSAKDWKIRNMALPSWTKVFNTYSCSVFTFQIANAFGIILLWSGIFFAAASYFVSLSLAVACGPLQSGTIFTEYLDNKNVWYKKTWLDMKLNPLDNGYNLQNVLRKCSKNSTIFNALDVKDHWNAESVFENADVTLDIDSLSNTIKNAIENIEISNSKLMGFSRNYFQSAEEYVIINFTPEILYDVEVMNSYYIKNELNDMTNNLQSETIKEHLNNILYNIKYLDNENLEKVNNLLHQIKEKLRNVQEKLYIVMNVKMKISKIIKQNASSISRLESIETVSEIIKLINETKYDIEHIALNQMGNCKFLPDAIDKEVNMLCNLAPYILNATWAIFTINTILMIICMMINDNLWKHLIDMQASQRRWRKIVDSINIKDRRFTRPSVQEGYLM